jgi:hypothetical protein
MKNKRTVTVTVTLELPAKEYGQWLHARKCWLARHKLTPGEPEKVLAYAMKPVLRRAYR